MDFVFRTQTEILEEKRNLVVASMKGAPAALVTSYRDGILFISENKYLHEQVYYTDPVTSSMGYVGNGSIRNVQKVQRFIVTSADMALLEYNKRRTETASKNVNAQFITNTYIVPELDKHFMNPGLLAIEANVIIADAHSNNIHTVFFDGSPETKNGIASIGLDVAPEKPNAAETYLRNPANGWRADLSLDQALASAVKALYNARKNSEERKYYQNLQLEVAVLDRTLGDDLWAPITSARNPCYAKSPLSAEQAQEIMRSALR